MTNRWNIKRKIEWMEKRLILQAVARTPTREAARVLLGLSKQGFMNKIRRYGLLAIVGHEYPACPKCGRAGKPKRRQRPSR